MKGSARQLFKICRASAEIPNTLVVTFDSRNHGERLVDDQKNGTWMDGNATHALDMYSIMYLNSTGSKSDLGIYLNNDRMGNVSDISLLIDLLPSFLGVDVHRFGVAGVSLGGHSVLMALGHGISILLINFSNYSNCIMKSLEYRSRCPSLDVETISNS